MKLHYNPLSTYSQKVLIALHEKGVTFEPAVVDLTNASSRAAYEAIYPIGKIPLLVLDDGHMIPESTIIIEYLEGHYPNQGTTLMPEGVDAARQVRFMDRVADLYLNNPVVTLLFDRLGLRKHDEATLQTATRQLRYACERLNQRLEKQPWLCGEQFSMADCAAIPPLFYAPHCAPLADYPHLARYAERAKSRPSYARVMAEFVPIWQGMMARKG